MATVSELLTWMELELHGWVREGARGTRPILNQVHKMLLTQECEQNLILDDATGDFPFITTRNNVFAYDCPADVWRIGKILIDADTQLSVDYNSAVVPTYDATTISGKQYYRIRNTDSRDSRPNRAARLFFKGVNPGATTAVYRRYAWRLPVEITSSMVQHEMPGSTDVEILLPCAMRWVDAINDHANLEAVRNDIITIWKPLVYREMNRGEHGSSDFSIKRDY